MAFALSLLVVSLASDAPGSLHEAVESEDLASVRRLLESGVDPDADRTLGLTPLMRAVIRDRNDIVAALIDGGADLAATTAEGLQPVHLAARADATESLQALISAGANPTATSDNGMNALDHAAAAGSVASIDLLVSLGLDPDAPSDTVSQGHGYPRDRGSTPLGIAVREGQVAAVRALVALGADIDGRSEAGHTPLLIAVFAAAPPETVDLLLEHGADPTVIAPCDEACSEPPGDVLAWARRLQRDELIPILSQAVAR